MAAAHDAGAIGKTSTGGGLGGCIIALAHSVEHAEQLGCALREAGATRTWTATVPGRERTHPARRATARAHRNIALVNTGQAGRVADPLPVAWVASSLTLDAFATTTTVEVVDGLATDELPPNGTAQNGDSPGAVLAR